MTKIESNVEKLKQIIEQTTSNNPDYIFKIISFQKTKICIIFCESLTSRTTINDFILRFFKIQSDKKVNNVINFLEEKIPVDKIIKLDNYEELMYNLCCGFTIIAIDGYNEVLSLETKASLNSPITQTQNETVIKGPNDGFNENYQVNIGLIRRRLKSDKLCIDELVVGKISKTKVAILYMRDIASLEIKDQIKNKIAGINIDAIIDTNYVIDTICGNSNKVLPTYTSTERPDLVCTQLLEGKIAIIVENAQLVAILPYTFFEMFKNPEDNYQTPMNANYTRVIRFLAFTITVLTPAVYLAMITYNHETIPTTLLINFAIQRDGVPIPSILEALLMLLTFEILKETDARIPHIIGSSLSIVGALVLGDAAVTAGVVSPIMVIIIAITAISAFILSYLDVSNGCRWWRLLFLILASLGGMIGVVVAGLILIINLSSTKILGIPYLTPLSPLSLKDVNKGIFVTKKGKYQKRTSNLAKGNIKRGGN